MWSALLLARHVSTSSANIAAARRGAPGGVDLLGASLRELSLPELVFAADTLGRSRVRDWNLWRRLCERLKPELKGCAISDALKVVHAMAKVPYKPPGAPHCPAACARASLLSAVDRIVLTSHQSLEPRAVTQYFIDVHRLGSIEPNTFRAVVSSKVCDLAQFSAFDLCFVLHLSSKLQLRDPAILAAVSAAIAGDVDKYEHVCKDKALVSMVIRSLSFLQHLDELFNKLLYERLPGCIYAFGPQEMCNALFSIVVALQGSEYKPADADIVRVLLDRVSSHLPELVDIEINQLSISLFHLRHKLAPFDSRYEELLERIVALGLKFPPSTSKMQYKLGRLLDDLKVRYEEERPIGPYVLDYVIPSLQVAIEVNGYSHFYHQSTDFNAITRLKYRIVESLGWRVVSVNYFDWKNRSKHSKLEYLCGQIQGLDRVNVT